MGKGGGDEVLPATVMIVDCSARDVVVFVR